MRVTVLLALLAAPVQAEDLPWLGDWGGFACSDSVRLGSAEVTGPSGSCAVSAIIPLGASGATALRLDCAGEAVDVVLMYDREGDKVWLWDRPDRRAPRLLRRCVAG
jgi:hypothetical protein